MGEHVAKLARKMHVRPHVRATEHGVTRVKGHMRLYRGEGSHDQPSFYPRGSNDAGAWWTSDPESARNYARSAKGRLFEIDVAEGEAETRGGRNNYFIPDPKVRERRRAVDAAWADEPFTVNLRSDMSPLKDRRNYVARITGGSFHTGKLEREFVQGKPWMKVGEQTLTVDSVGGQRTLGTWTPIIPAVDGVYEVQTFRPDPHRKRPPERTRTYIVVKDGVAEVPDIPDPDEIQELIDG